MFDTIMYYLRKVKIINYFYQITVNRCHVIKTGLDKGNWFDKDTQILYGMMNLLVDYVEKEDCFGVIEWNSDEHHKKAAIEIKTIYDWWKNYKTREEEINNSTSKWHDEAKPCVENSYFKTTETETSKRLLKETLNLEEKLEKEEEEMLIRLIKIRGYLWT